MSLPRRRVIRPEVPTALANVQQEKIQKFRTRLQQEHERLKKWMSRLRRAFGTVEKQQRTIRRLERQISSLLGE